MNILVIGNGFDLEHGLPTQYKDFLDFMQGINLLSSKTKILDKNAFIEELERKHKVDENIKEYLTQEKFLVPSLMKEWKEEEISKELIECANNNIWIKYFIENMNYEKEGWIDLESEISNVIQCLDYMKNYSEYNRRGIGWPKERVQERDDKQEIVQKIIDYSKLNIEPFELMGKKLQEVINMLNNHLNNLVRCLEIYLEDCVGEVDIKYIAPDIEKFKPHKVLSFNYSKTYGKLYNLDKSISFSGSIDAFDYIHGKADITRKSIDNNMVLGIDEYLDDDLKDKELEFIEFKKYFQRIYKKTGSEYKGWIEIINELNIKSEIHIFGHSLDVTDKDIIKELIECENTVTTIFYYNKEVYAQQIANLVKVIGQDELIKRVSGANPTIIFKHQSKRRKRI